MDHEIRSARSIEPASFDSLALQLLTPIAALLVRQLSKVNDGMLGKWFWSRADRKRFGRAFCNN